SHPTYNNLNIVFTCGSIPLTVDEIKAHIEEDNVTDVYRFTRKSDGKSVPTNSYVVTMQVVKIPEYIYIGMKRIKTRVYYPRPMHCYTKITKITAKMAKPANHCAISSVHTTSKMHKLRWSTQCFRYQLSKYKQEEQLIKLKLDHNGSYCEAKQMMDSSSGPNTSKR
uniref:Uncharacterized protein n=1 Tax=Anopheles melas TaxID=34690 RepID=A0A182TUQ8_9DIPT